MCLTPRTAHAVRIPVFCTTYVTDRLVWMHTHFVASHHPCSLASNVLFLAVAHVGTPQERAKCCCNDMQFTSAVWITHAVSRQPVRRGMRCTKVQQCATRVHAVICSATQGCRHALASRQVGDSCQNACCTCTIVQQLIRSHTCTVPCVPSLTLCSSQVSFRLPRNG
jgi:hypothetical protein